MSQFLPPKWCPADESGGCAGVHPSSGQHAPFARYRPGGESRTSKLAEDQIQDVSLPDDDVSLNDPALDGLS